MKKVPITLLLGCVLLLAGCAERGDGGASGDALSGDYRQAGSSTVLPIAQAWAEVFGAEHRGVRLTVGGGGTGAGFNQFCRGEIAIADASRPIRDAEKEACAAAGVEPFEVQVAIDAIAVVVSKENTFATDLTVEELNRIWTADPAKQADRWSDLRPAWPNERIQLFGPGPDSGTFDYFVEVIIQPFDGRESKGRSDYTPSEDDNILVQGVTSSPYALGYFGLAYAVENADQVKPVPIDEGEGKGPVAPGAQSVEAGEYTPLARPIYMYTDGAPQGALREYFLWGLGEEGQALVEEVGYIRLPDALRQDMLAKLG